MPQRVRVGRGGQKQITHDLNRCGYSVRGSASTIINQQSTINRRVTRTAHAESGSDYDRVGRPPAGMNAGGPDRSFRSLPSEGHWCSDSAVCRPTYPSRKSSNFSLINRGGCPPQEVHRLGEGLQSRAFLLGHAPCAQARTTLNGRVTFLPSAVTSRQGHLSNMSVRTLPNSNPPI